MINGIYADRTFFVRNASHDSTTRPQESGIIQGCPLSPFLFSIAMTVLIEDVNAMNASMEMRTGKTRMERFYTQMTFCSCNLTSKLLNHMSIASAVLAKNIGCI